MHDPSIRPWMVQLIHPASHVFWQAAPPLPSFSCAEGDHHIQKKFKKKWRVTRGLEVAQSEKLSLILLCMRWIRHCLNLLSWPGFAPEMRATSRAMTRKKLATVPRELPAATKYLRRQ
ncbi:hypothetical protein M758_UG121400 [Ceratodon purpureus]|nr:hypothetical protein M758_UG121400 [Ceratodon purpureus]